MKEIPKLNLAFSQMLQEYREKTGLSQRKMALRMGCARSYIAFLEDGEHLPSLNTFLLVAEALEMDSVDFHKELKRRVEELEENG